MQTIGIDCRFASTDSGIGRYTREIVTRFIAERRDEHLILFVRNREEKWFKSTLPTWARTIEAPFAHYSLEEQTKFPKVLKESGIDLLFTPHFNVPYRCPVPFVCTIHDLILHRYPNTTSAWKQYAYRFLMKRSVEKAAALIAVSSFTKKELIDVYGPVVKDKTLVIPESVSPAFSPRPKEEFGPVLQAYHIKAPYFLYVGNAKQHKNVSFLIHAFLQANLPEHSLVLVTDGPESEQLQQHPKVHRVPLVADRDLPVLYSAADALVTASLYEGFCFPIVEAQACGCPVIAVNATAIPEVAGPNAKLLPPTIEPFVSAFQSPAPHSASLLPKFSWDEVAERTYTVLSETVRKSRMVGRHG